MRGKDKKVVLFSGHLYDSKRNAGFHHIANSLLSQGFDVLFVTAPYSLLNQIKNFRGNKLNYQSNKIKIHNNGMKSYVHYTPFHVANLRIDALNNWTKNLYKIYQKFPLHQIEEFLTDSNFIIFESTPGLFLIDAVKKINSDAKYIYRVSDDLELLGVHPSLLDYEQSKLESFDLISVPSQYIYKKLREKDNKAKVKLQYHGINKEIFDKEENNPYKSNSINAVFVGISRLDYDFICLASKRFSHIHFHIIGPIERKVKSHNIHYYGEIPFQETIKYVKYADIGLHTLCYSKGAESFTDSLKVQQYTYCNLPIIAPNFLKSNRENKLYYERDYSNLDRVFEECRKFNFDNKQKVNSWEELSKMLCDLS
ncbi:GumK N-terminal domain-containing glycosyltransferase [Robertkochia aurantiaca]|uniref:GumK N-terminal domain-containing glycosyltransferase n=1 Tax=Robertkochia aurantiaca TaxID=2873700 RepID=UPI001CCF6D79|nr:hypothetical protein [Robertkochia sp. 3YJGBD-33]